MGGKPWCVREGSKRPTTSCKFTIEVKSKKVFCRHLLIFWLQSRLITPITEGVGYSAFLLRPIHCDVNILKSWHQSDTQLKGHMKRYWDMDSFGVEGHPPRLKGRNYRSISATLMLCVHWNNSVFGLSPTFLPVLCVQENSTTPGHPALCLCLCLCSLWALSARVDENDFSTVSIFFISSSAPTKCFSLPLSRPFWTQITFRFNFACFFMGGRVAVELWFTL